MWWYVVYHHLRCSVVADSIVGIVNAPPGKALCPQGMCCSRYGYVFDEITHLVQVLTIFRYCGTGTDYCGLGCQSNCKLALPKMSAPMASSS